MACIEGYDRPAAGYIRIFLVALSFLVLPGVPGSKTGQRPASYPDGRIAAAPVSSNLSPSFGLATHGASAAINSFAKLNLVDLPSGSPLDIALDPASLEGEEGLERLMALVQSFLDQKGNMLTISVNSVDQLREAQTIPDQHRDLMVRVSGWHAYFVDLELPHQNSQIRKLEQYVD